MYSTTTVHRIDSIYTGHLQRDMDSRDSDALTATPIIPSMHYWWSSVLLNMEIPAGYGSKKT